MKAIDLFAGAGGFTTGASAAGVEVIWAANHWPVAVDVHRANHPDTVHSCQDLHQADWTQVPAMDLVLASPACQGHSRARGRERSHHDAARSTAWAVISCAEYHEPAAIIVENVPEFRTWKLFPAWRQALEALGYAISEQVINAADAGVPQNRERLFVVGTRSSRPLEIPQPTESHVGARGFVDLDSGSWTQVEKPGRAVATLCRVNAGRKVFGRAPFLMAYYGQERGGRSLDRPLGTVTTRDRHAIVHGDRMRMLTISEYRAAMGFPKNYELPKTKRLATHLLGNAVCPPVATHVIETVRKAA